MSAYWSATRYAVSDDPTDAWGGVGTGVSRTIGDDAGRKYVRFSGTNSSQNVFPFLYQPAVQDFELLALVRGVGAFPVANIGGRWGGTQPPDEYLGAGPNGGTDIQYRRITGGSSVANNFTTLTDTTDWFYIRVRAITAEGDFRVKVWAEGDTEPGTWQTQQSASIPTAAGQIAIWQDFNEFDLHAIAVDTTGGTATLSTQRYVDAEDLSDVGSITQRRGSGSDVVDLLADDGSGNQVIRLTRAANAIGGLYSYDPVGFVGPEQEILMLGRIFDDGTGDFGLTLAPGLRMHDPGGGFISAGAGFAQNANLDTVANHNAQVSTPGDLFQQSTGFDPTALIWLRVRLETDGAASDLFVKVWADGDPEPGTWTYTVQDYSNGYADQPGYMGFVAKGSAAVIHIHYMGFGFDGSAAPDRPGAGATSVEVPATSLGFTGYAPTVAASVLGLRLDDSGGDNLLRDTDTGALITQSAVEVVVIDGTPGSRSIVYQGTVDITSGVMDDIIDPVFSTLSDTFLVVLAQSATIATPPIPATVVDTAA